MQDLLIIERKSKQEAADSWLLMGMQGITQCAGIEQMWNSFQDVEGEMEIKDEQIMANVMMNVTCLSFFQSRKRTALKLCKL